MLSFQVIVISQCSLSRQCRRTIRSKHSERLSRCLGACPSTLLCFSMIPKKTIEDAQACDPDKGSATGDRWPSVHRPWRMHRCGSVSTNQDLLQQECSSTSQSIYSQMHMQPRSTSLGQKQSPSIGRWKRCFTRWQQRSARIARVAPMYRNRSMCY